MVLGSVVRRGNLLTAAEKRKMGNFLANPLQTLRNITRGTMDIRSW